MKSSIVTLIERIQQGDQQAMSELYEATYADAYKMAMRLCRDEGDAQDAVQDAFLEIFQSIHKLRDPNSYYLWLSRIVTSKCTRIFRKKRHMTLEPEQMGRLPNQVEKKKAFIPHLQIEEEEERQLMHTFVDELSPILKETVELVYFKQMSIEEVSAYLQVPIGTIKSRLHYARNILHKKISGFEQEEGRKVHFYEGVSAWILAKLVLIKTSVKKTVTSNHVSSIASNAVIGVGAVSVTILGVQGANEVYKNLQEPAPAIAQAPLQQPPVEEKKEEVVLPKPLFEASYQDKSYTNPKEAYYEILRWGQDASFAAALPKEERETILPLYNAIKQSKGPFWDMLVHEGWQNIFE